MADKQYNLVRSFYGWLHKAERDLRGKSSRTQARPTTIVGAARVAKTVCESMAGTRHADKASYYLRLFDGILEQGWQD